MTPSEFIRRTCNQSIADGVMNPDKVIRWSEAEIANAESTLGLRFPAYYREFLRGLGKSGGGFMRGTNIFPRSVDDFAQWREVAAELLAESGEALPSDAFVFGHHQGYQFWYFTTDSQSDDPPVLYYLEGETRPRQVHNSFSQFVSELVEDRL